MVGRSLAREALQIVRLDTHGYKSKVEKGKTEYLLSQERFEFEILFL